jgi:hypothetical protein
MDIPQLPRKETARPFKGGTETAGHVNVGQLTPSGEPVVLPQSVAPTMSVTTILAITGVIIAVVALITRE